MSKTQNRSRRGKKSAKVGKGRVKVSRQKRKIVKAEARKRPAKMVKEESMVDFGGQAPTDKVTTDAERRQREKIDNALPGELEGLTQEEIDKHKGTLKAILVAVREGLGNKREDGELTCEEIGQVIGAALPAVGRLADELIADIKD